MDDSGSIISPPSSPSRGKNSGGPLAKLRKHFLARKTGKRVDQLDDPELNGCGADSDVAVESTEAAASPETDRSRENAAIPLASSNANASPRKQGFVLFRRPPRLPKDVPRNAAAVGPIEGATARDAIEIDSDSDVESTANAETQVAARPRKKLKQTSLSSFLSKASAAVARLTARRQPTSARSRTNAAQHNAGTTIAIEDAFVADAVPDAAAAMEIDGASVGDSSGEYSTDVEGGTAERASRKRKRKKGKKANGQWNKASIKTGGPPCRVRGDDPVPTEKAPSRVDPEDLLPTVPFDGCRGWPVKYTRVYASDEEVETFELYHTDEKLSAESPLPASVFNSWWKAGKLRQVPSDLFYLNGEDRSAEFAEEAPDDNTDDEEVEVDPDVPDGDGKTGDNSKRRKVKPDDERKSGDKGKRRKVKPDDEHKTGDKGKRRKVKPSELTPSEAEPDNGRKRFLLGHFAGFVEKPAVVPARNDSYYYEHDEKGRVLMTVHKQNDGHVHYRSPTVLFMHEDGFVVCCKTGWAMGYGEQGKKNLADIKAGLKEKLGECGGRESPKKGMKGLFLRSYSILSAQPDTQGYLRCTLYSAGCDKTNKSFYVHHVSLIAYEGRRPDGCIGHHIGERSDNSIFSLQWIPRSDNSRSVNLDRNNSAANGVLTAEETFKVFPVPGMDYYQDPDFPHIVVSKDGTHVFNRLTGRYIIVQKQTFPDGPDGFAKYRLSVPDPDTLGATDKTVDFSRYLLEAFIGRRLKKGETCDHRDHNRSNNAYGNLLPRHRLFQANNRKMNFQGKREDGSILGVYRKLDSRTKKWAYWVASYRAYTPDGSTESKELQKNFSIAKLGYEKALADAIAFREKSHSTKGMNFDFDEGVEPVIRG